MKITRNIKGVLILYLLTAITQQIHAQGYGGATGHGYDTYVINSDRSNHRSEFRMQTADKSFTFSHTNNRMGLFYQSNYTGWQDRGGEIFTISNSGNTRMNNVFAGDVGHGTHWAGFTHKDQANKLSYSLLASKDGKYTLINKKNTGDGFIGFRVGNSDKMVLTNPGNLGIGTTSPTSKLHIVVPNDRSADPNNNGIMVYNNGNSGANDDAIVTARVNGANSGNPFFSVDVKGVSGWSMGMDNVDSDKFKIANSWSKLNTRTYLTIDRDGDTGIGTTNPSEKLHVQGNIKVDNGNFILGQSQLSSTTENSNTLLNISGGVKTDKVILNIGTFPDYVFADEYPLMPIEEVADYIKKNKHLPNIPSEKEMVASGLDLQMINIKLVEKIEELTLYTIQQQKIITAQEKAIANQQQSISKQQQMLLELLNRIEKLEK